MGRAEERVSVRELVLLVVDAAGGNIEGRTAAQKLCYFAAAALGDDAGHRAHFYGPYSRPVENALNNSAFAGDLTETVRPFDSGAGSTYCYELTEQGRSAVSEIKADYPSSAEIVRTVVSHIEDLVPGFRQSKLSLAAKVDLIVSERGQATDSAAIPLLAKELGWKVNSAQVDDAVQVLVGLGRVHVADAH